MVLMLESVFFNVKRGKKQEQTINIWEYLSLKETTSNRSGFFPGMFRSILFMAI